MVAVARKGEAPIAQVAAADFGISESCLRNRMHQADVENGVSLAPRRARTPNRRTPSCPLLQPSMSVAAAQDGM